MIMPHSIDHLSIKKESQKVTLSPEPIDMGYSEFSDHDKGIFRINGLIKQEPITVF